MGKNKHIIHHPMSRRQMLGACRSGFGSLAFFVSLFGGLGAACSEAEKLSLICTFRLPESLSTLIFPKPSTMIFFVYGRGRIAGRLLYPKPRLAQENGEDPYKKFNRDATRLIASAGF